MKLRHAPIWPAVLVAACVDGGVNTYAVPPLAQILQPEDGALITEPSVTFVGSVTDEDPPESLAVRWTSSQLEEPLSLAAADSTGRLEFTVLDLPVGEHLIELHATDADAQTDVASVTITVSQLADPPLVFINSPQPALTYWAGGPIEFDGFVTDSAGTPGLHPVEWATDSLGPVYTGVTGTDGRTTFETSLDAGPHLIQLRTFDDFGTLALASVSITVLEPNVGQLDQDGDGFCPDGVDSDGDGRCLGIEVTGPDSQDCDDSIATVCPGCPEICDGEPDNDCDGVDDNSDLDADGDLWSSCEGDCDDQAAWNYPGNLEVCDGLDDDCDGIPDADVQGEVDADLDGVRTCGDCDDGSALRFPGNPEVCDGIDNDCNGVPDDGWDGDGDGFTLCDGDCDDGSAQRFPGNVEICDNIDNDCEGGVDENFDPDGDGWTSCEGDCDNGDGANFPGNIEWCDGGDNDCDGLPDEGFDQDGDTFTTCEGDCNDLQPSSRPGLAEACDNLDNDCNSVIDDGFDQDADGWTTCEGDCDDGQVLVFPGRAENCDNLDNDCDGIVDDGWDADGDGWSTCENDCNDALAGANPGAAEVCDSADNDCDGYVNEDQAGPYEMWETNANSNGYALSSVNPQIVFGSGACSIGGFLVLQPGSASVSGVFSSPFDLWDIFEFDTDLTTNLAAWLAFLSSGSGLPSGCTTGSVSWSASMPISVTVEVDGTPYSGTGTSGSVSFGLSIFQLFDVEYRVIVQPLGVWSHCNHSYTLNFYVP